MYPLSEGKNIINKQESIFGDVTKYQPSIMYPLKSKISSSNTKNRNLMYPLLEGKKYNKQIRLDSCHILLIPECIY